MGTPHGIHPCEVFPGFELPDTLLPCNPTLTCDPGGTIIESPPEGAEKERLRGAPPINFCLPLLAEMAAAHALPLIHWSREDCHSA